MEWRPYLATELAVGCSSGLLIWNVDPNSVVARPSAGISYLLLWSFILHGTLKLITKQLYLPEDHSNLILAGCVSLLQSPGHSPVTSISWHPNGSLLLSASAADTSLILWNTASETKVPLRCMGAGCHMVHWSPNPELVFAATTSTVFRIWSTRMWTNERWNVLSGKNLPRKSIADLMLG